MTEQKDKVMIILTVPGFIDVKFYVPLKLLDEFILALAKNDKGASIAVKYNYDLD